MSDDEPPRDAPPPDLTGDPWQTLRALTPARIALGRAGAALPTAEVLAFGLAHAEARDAVHTPLDVPALTADLAAAGFAPVVVTSAAPDRATYLARPDLGRRLAAPDARRLAAGSRCDLAFVVADGLSARAGQAHATPLLVALRPLLNPAWRLAPVVCVATQARVALGDEVGATLGARLVAVLIGERPGLSSPDSLGVYLTFDPRPGRTDAERNCLSNIRPAGLPVARAAARLAWLLHAALALERTGIELRDESESRLPRAGPAATGRQPKSE